MITSKVIRAVHIGRVAIRFLYCTKQALIPNIQLQVKTGYIKVATQDATAFDLCKYYRTSGYWSNVATILSELKEQLDFTKLAAIATSKVYGVAVLQRLGFLLSLPEVAGASLVNSLQSIISETNASWIPLQPGKSIIGAKRDLTWRIYINEQIELDV